MFTTRSRSTRRLQLLDLETRTVPSSVDVLFNPTVQGNSGLSTSVSSINTNQEYGQTFTVGTTGQLTNVDVYVRRFSGTIGALMLDVRAQQISGLPTSGSGEILAQAILPSSSVATGTATFHSFDISAAGLMVTAGQKLALALHVQPETGGNVTYQWTGSTENRYTGGTMVGRVIGNHDWLAPDPAWDLGFRTWVDAAPILPPEVTLPGSGVSYAENAEPVLLAPTATVTDGDSANFNTGTLTVSLTANGTVDDRLRIRHEGMDAGQIGVNGATISFGGTAMGTLSGGMGTTPLVITLNATATPATTEALLRNVTFETVADVPSTATRTVQVVLSDGAGGTSSPDTTTVTVSATNDAPEVMTNLGLTLNEGATGTITTARLATADPDNTLAQLTYTVTTAPLNGSIEIAGVPTTTFTQADLSNNLITYTHNGSETTTDSMVFTVSDGTATTSTTTFAFTITPQNDSPVITTNTGFDVVRNFAVTLTPAKLTTTDPDAAPAQLTYTVTSAPTHGVVRLNGIATTTFTQADLNAGLVSYRHDGSAPTSDSFNVVVSDGTLSSNTTTVNVNVLAFAGSVIHITAVNVAAGTVTFTGDGGLALDDSLQLWAEPMGNGQFVLGHSANDPDLVDATDVDPNTAGVQQLLLGSGTAPLLTVQLLTGADSVQLDNTDSLFTTPVAVDGGADVDELQIIGNQPHTWTIAGTNSGAVTGTPVTFVATENLLGTASADTFAFTPNGTIGHVDGGAGTNTLDYSALSSPVEAFLSAGVASRTQGIANIGIVGGGSASDTLMAGSTGATLVGGAGDDTILGGAANDVLTGGAGNDLLSGSGGIDTVEETILTTLTITLTNMALNGGPETGVDLLVGIEAANVTGGPGNNVIRATGFTVGSVTLNGGLGNDKIYGGPNGDWLSGGDGKDNLIGGLGNDTFTGGAGNDVLNGGKGDDLVRETNITGTNVTLTSSKLKTLGLLGIDTLVSIGRAYLSLAESETTGRVLNAAGFRSGPVTLIGAQGADTLTGPVKAGDSLVGGMGSDVLNSGKGADTVDGGADLDVVITLNDATLGDTLLNLP